MFRRVLAPLDGSVMAQQGLALAALVARRADAELHLVHVLVPVIVGDPMMQYTMVDVETPEQAHKYMSDLLKRQSGADKGKAPVLGVLDGPVTTSLAEYTRNQDIDLVVMTTHGRGPLGRLWSGSIANELVRDIPTPILLLRSDDEATEVVAPREFRRVLIAVDGTVESEAVLEPALEMARVFDAAVTLLRVIPPHSEPVEKSTQPPPVMELPLHSGAGPEAELDRLAQKIRQRKIIVQPVLVEHREPDRAIVEEARRLSCDLIALETHGRSGLARLFAGSIADKVVRGAPCPVLLHHSRPTSGEAMKPHRHEDELVTVYEAPDSVTAQIIAADLQGEGIASTVSGENQAGFSGVPAVEVEVLVKADDADRARKIIAQHERRHDKAD